MSVARAILPMLRLCRLYYAIPMSLTYLLTVYYARSGAMAGRWAADVLSTMSLAMVIAAAYIVNDVMDRHVDSVNNPTRPIASGKVAPRAAAVLGGLLLLGGVGLASCCPWPFFVCLCLVAAGLMVYDLLSKRMGMVKQVLAAALMTSIYPLAMAQAWPITAGPRTGSLAVFPAYLFLTAFAYEVLKDLRDRAGDPPVAGRPTPIQRRPERWRRLAGAVLPLAASLLVVPFFLGCGRVYLAGAVAGIVLAVAAARAPVRRAIKLVYVECFIVALAAAADVIVA